MNSSHDGSGAGGLHDGGDFMLLLHERGGEQLVEGVLLLA